MLCDVTKQMSMNIIDRHFSVTRTLLEIIGLWPYQTSIFARLQFLCVFTLITSTVIFEVAIFLTSSYNTNLILKILSFGTFYIFSIINYYSVYINRKTVKYLMKSLHDSFDNISDSNEIIIIKKYGSNVKRYVIIFLTVFGCVTFGLVTFRITDFFTNNTTLSDSMSRQRPVLKMANLDTEMYYYLLSAYIHLTLATCSYVLIATGVMFIAYIQLFCAMFKIASYRVDHAMKIHALQNSLRNENSVYRSIIYATDLHQNSKIFCKNLISSFDKTFIILTMGSVLSVSCTMFNALLYRDIDNEFLISITMILCILLYQLVANLMGQDVIDHYAYVFATAYNVRWYAASIRIQKLILLLLQKGQRAFGLNSMGGFFTASLHCFASLINASMSYFTVLYSIGT